MPIFASQFPIYQPAMRIINTITNDFPALVTTTFNHQYLNGTILRLNIPQGFGMTQANQLIGSIVVTGNATFLIDIDTRYFDPFVPPITFPDNAQYAQVTPVGELNETLLAATQNVLPYAAT